MSNNSSMLQKEDDPHTPDEVTGYTEEQMITVEDENVNYKDTDNEELDFSISVTERNGSPFLNLDIASPHDIRLIVRETEKPWGDHAYGLEIKVLADEGGQYLEKIGEAKISYTYEPTNHLPNIPTKYTEMWHLKIEEGYRRNGYGSFLFEVARAIGNHVGETFMGSIGSSAITHRTLEDKKRNDKTIEFLKNKGIPRYNIIRSNSFIGNVQFAIDPDNPEKDKVSEIKENQEKT